MHALELRNIDSPIAAAAAAAADINSENVDDNFRSRPEKTCLGHYPYQAKSGASSQWIRLYLGDSPFEEVPFPLLCVALRGGWSIVPIRYFVKAYTTAFLVAELCHGEPARFTCPSIEEHNFPCRLQHR